MFQRYQCSAAYKAFSPNFLLTLTACSGPLNIHNLLFTDEICSRLWSGKRKIDGFEKEIEKKEKENLCHFLPFRSEYLLSTFLFSFLIMVHSIVRLTYIIFPISGSVTEWIYQWWFLTPMTEIVLLNDSILFSNKVFF